MSALVITYVICLALMLVTFLIAGKKSELPIWQKALMVLFAPLVIAFALLYIIFVLPVQHVREQGFHGFLPRRKGKAYPISEMQSKYLSKDTVCDGEKDTMTIDEFNEKYGKSLSLDDVYGKGYTERITPEEYYQCKITIPGKVAMQPNIPQTSYLDAAKVLAECIVSDDFQSLKPWLSDNPYLTSHSLGQVSGRDDVIESLPLYMESLRQRHPIYRVSIDWCAKQCRPGVTVRYPGHEPHWFLLRLSHDKIADIVIAPRLTNHCNSILCDLQYPQYNVARVAPYLLEDEEALDDHLVCPTCGRESAMLDWYRFRMPIGKLGWMGKLTYCPECNRVVEILPEKNITGEKIETQAFPVDLQSHSTVFKPSLLGVMSFETTDDQMDFYENRIEVHQRKYKEYSEDGNLESGNDAAIIEYNEGYNTVEEVASLFTELSEKGNHNAMANLFTVYWSDDQYEKAAEWLIRVNEFENPSLRCVWNLAYMYYCGDELPHNTLPKNRKLAEQLLKKILKLAALPDSDESLVPKVYEFLCAFNKLNQFSAIGVQLHNRITNSIVLTESLKDKGEFFNVANCLSPKDGLKLGLQLASDQTHDIGDESRFYFYAPNSEEFKFSPKHLNVEKSAMGAWQLYLMATAPTIMPVFWHGGYICRDFIFDKSDLSKIKPIRRFDFSILNEDGILLPNVVLSDDKKSADVYCTYWNDWKGLVREHVKVTFLEDGSAELGEPDEFVYYAYDCGICF